MFYIRVLSDKSSAFRLCRKKNSNASKHNLKKQLTLHAALYRIFWCMYVLMLRFMELMIQKLRVLYSSATANNNGAGGEGSAALYAQCPTTSLPNLLSEWGRLTAAEEQARETVTNESSCIFSLLSVLSPVLWERHRARNSERERRKSERVSEREREREAVIGYQNIRDGYH